MKKTITIALLLLAIIAIPPVHADQPITYSQMMREYSQWSHGKGAQNQTLTTSAREELRQRLISLFPPFIESERANLTRLNATEESITAYVSQLNGQLQNLRDNLAVIQPDPNAEPNMSAGLNFSVVGNQNVNSIGSITLQGNQNASGQQLLQNGTNTSGTVTVPTGGNQTPPVVAEGSDAGSTTTITNNRNMSILDLNTGNVTTPNRSNTTTIIAEGSDTNNTVTNTPGTPDPSKQVQVTIIGNNPYVVPPRVTPPPAVTPPQVVRPPVPEPPEVTTRQPARELRLAVTPAEKKSNTTSDALQGSPATEKDPRAALLQRRIAMTERNVDKLSERMEKMNDNESKAQLETRVRYFKRILMLIQKRLERMN